MKRKNVTLDALRRAAMRSTRASAALENRIVLAVWHIPSMSSGSTLSAGSAQNGRRTRTALRDRRRDDERIR
jgi:hypothetical protein